MERFSWTEKVSNLEILARVKETLQILKHLEKSGGRILGHILMYVYSLLITLLKLLYKFITNIIEGQKEGRKRGNQERSIWIK